MDTFSPFPKMPRLRREVVITEKIDGTNAQIFIWDQNLHQGVLPPEGIPWIFQFAGLSIAAGSRNRWITSSDDNYGFASWVTRNAVELAKLGDGRHFGEWWGNGIQRNYGVADKRFSLFNVSRFAPTTFGADVATGFWRYDESGVMDSDGSIISCCRVVPTIWRGTFDTFDTRNAIEMLRSHGSFAAPGFKAPEGIVVYHTASKQYFKQTVEKDESAKGQVP